MTTLTPTGTCYDDALDILQGWLVNGTAGDRQWLRELRVVHGIKETGGVRFSHAWLERDERVWQAAMMEDTKVVIEIPKDDFYKNVVTSTKYSLEETWNKNHESGHYGPWDEAYGALCHAGDSSPRLVGSVAYGKVRVMPFPWVRKS